ncbi:biotin-dependent carboxyltransferase family protein [Allokutzneria sp. A3M-2-11 16]|uniref:5-oxoprolinase subunit C family protein n=1 Tax=Allokutzneria sp. A3M-2-11 16 TaxID=2962043 RepID=UPI0020B87D63|nr:biotin-dependent carboxyltransferase family protein [Allokutzneria sp. A3M-2-11 16]MCP3802689.1 biotin-dependent carboxyltransferase family protein [Allokutzneria sp. A3M-2-11 16]
MITIVNPGPQALVQDLGRPGLATLGVGRSGAADRRSLALANRLVGNPETNAGIEITFGGLVARFAEAALVAVTGAPCPVEVGTRAADMYGPIRVRAGDELKLGRPSAGLRSYLAVRGGIEVPKVLGSRATDLLAGLGPEPLAAEAVLPIGVSTEDYPGVDLAPQAPYSDEPVLRVLPGPRADWFTEDALESLCGGKYEVSTASNRIGVRLTGPVLRRREPDRELPPEAMVLGALQVPPSGQPILFLADHPVTGGYPVIGVVEPADLHLAAQLRPGQRIRFRAVAP